MRHLHLESVHSTNSYLLDWLRKDPDLPSLTVVTAYDQTAGRGQKGNHWEAAAGENITLSLLLRPDRELALAPFDLNVVTSLALADLLEEYLTNQVEIKWPNDLLVEGKRKIAGILTENAWLGNSWDYSIIGVGLNVCQKSFGSYAPPATSMVLEGYQPDQNWHDVLVRETIERIEERLAGLADDSASLREEYHSHLFRYRQPGCSYRTAEGTTFRGMLLGVHPNGLLDIEDEASGEVRSFAFKEVQFW